MSAKIIAYAVKHRQDDVRWESRSGGIFTALSDEILNEGGAVFGCVMDEDFSAVHKRADSIDDRNKMRGSKYIQSRMNDCFIQVKDCVLQGKKVLFSGTSCQISGLKAFLGKEYDNLILVDIVCHGVPSPAVWQSYLDWQSKKNRGQIVTVDFRNKKDFGWAAHVETLFLRCKHKIKRVDSRVFRELFRKNIILRPACYKCPYKSITHPADITIADYWGIDYAAPGFNDNKGVSLVLINTDKGNAMFDKVKDCIEFRQTEIEKSLQLALKEPFERPEERDAFWHDYEELTFEALVKKYAPYGFKERIKDKIKKFIYGKK